jgi:apolipoprotein N-acyltransferase
VNDIKEIDSEKTVAPSTSLSSEHTPLPRSPFRFGLRMAILSGLLLWLTHPTPGLWPLAWVALVPLILSVQQAKSIGQATMRGYWFGWAYFAPTCYWTGLTIVGWTQSPIGWGALFLLTLLAAWFYAFWAGAAWWLSKRTTGTWRMAALAAAWVIMEWLRSAGSLTFPWAQVCYTQYRFLPVIQIAEVTGAFGVSFLILLVNASIAEWWQNRKEPQSQRWVWRCLTLVGLLCLSGMARMVQLSDGKAIQVAIMQGDFNYNNSPDIINAQKMQTFEALTQAAYRTAPLPPSLYVWAESAAPGDALHTPASRDLLQRLADTYHAPILTGSYILDPKTNEETNSALLFTPDGMPPQRFDKLGIVPFGEFIPFRGYVPSVIQKQFQFFDTDVTPGQKIEPMHFTDATAGNVSLGPFICYESVYSHYARMMTQRGANLLVTPSHDQWFHSESAMEQHLAIVVFRAVENRRDVARATTDGISCVIDGRGHVLARAPLSTPCFLVRTLHLRELQTIYTRFGDWFVIVCVIIVMLSIIRSHQLARSAGSRNKTAS